MDENTIVIKIGREVIACTGQNHMIGLHNINTGLCIKYFIGPTKRIKCLLCLYHKTIASSGEDKQIKLWTINHDNFFLSYCSMTINHNAVINVLLHINMFTFASAGDDCNIKFWKLQIDSIGKAA